MQFTTCSYPVLRRPAGLWTAVSARVVGPVLGLFFSTAAQAACWASATGRLASLEALAFRAPAQALQRLQALEGEPEFKAPGQRAAWSVLAADAARQLGQDSASRAYADAGLATLGADRQSDLALRLRAARAMQMDTTAGALTEIGAVLQAVGERPLARGCVLRDRGWLRLGTQDLEGALADLIQAQALLVWCLVLEGT